MEDVLIVELFFRRDESAITETARKYGPLCRSIAINLLGSPEDAEECVNDVYERAWSSIPPQRPEKLGAWLGKLARNVSVDRFRRERAQKRFNGVETALTELEECLPSPDTPEREMESRELGAAISAWLRRQSEEDRALFVRRYFSGEALRSIARDMGVPENRLSQRMTRLRRSLRDALSKEGIAV